MGFFYQSSWLKRLLEEFRLSSVTPLKLFCDNRSAISIAHNPVHHDHTKPVEVEHHFIKEKIEEGIICMTYLNQVAGC